MGGIKLIFSNNKNRGIESFCSMMAFLLLLIAVKMSAQWLNSLDLMIQNATTISPNSILAQIFKTLTFFGSPAVALLFSAILAVFFFYKREWVTSLWITFTILGGDAIAFIVKEVVRRPRPLGIIGGDTGFSFPSGHVFGTTILIFFVIYIIGPRIKSYENRILLTSIMWLWLIIILISRICLRSHYPSDVLGSILLAISWWKFAQVLYVKYYSLAKSTIEHLTLKRVN